MCVMIKKVSIQFNFMFLLDIKRIIRSGVLNFYRNGIVSLASTLVLWVTLSVVLGIIFFQAILNNSLEQVKDKVDITVYFVPEAKESKILEFKDIIQKLPEVEAISYISADISLAQFKERRKDDQLTLQALDEIGENPLGGSINIKAKDPTQYESISNFLSGDSESIRLYQDIIYNINYHKNKNIIDRLNNIILSAKILGGALALILMIISVIITFNTIRLTIFISKEEIGVMRLVGASSRYVTGPFMVEGMICGIVAAFLSVAVYYPISVWLSNKMTSFLGIDMLEYYTNHFLEIILIALLFGVLLGSISSALAVRKYLSK